MNIPSLGPLTVHPEVKDWLVSQPVAVPYFDNAKLTFTLDSLEDSDQVDARSAVDSFLGLTVSDRLAASAAVYGNYTETAELVDECDLGCEIATAAEVWEFVHPTGIFVSRSSYGDKAVYVWIAAECDWEPEHGLQIVYRWGKELSRVSEQDGNLVE